MFFCCWFSCSIVGNPLICGANTEKDCYGTAPMPMSYNLNSSQGSLPPGKSKSHKFAVAFGTATGCISFLFLTAGFVFWWRHRRNRQILFDFDGKQALILMFTFNPCIVYLTDWQLLMKLFLG